MSEQEETTKIGLAKDVAALRKWMNEGTTRIDLQIGDPQWTDLNGALARVCDAAERNGRETAGEHPFAVGDVVRVRSLPEAFPLLVTSTRFTTESLNLPYVSVLWVRPDAKMGQAQIMASALERCDPAEHESSDAATVRRREQLVVVRDGLALLAEPEALYPEDGACRGRDPVTVQVENMARLATRLLDVMHNGVLGGRS